MKLAADPDVIQTLGLMFDVVGILILFRWQIDFNRNVHDGRIEFALRLGTEEPSAEAKRKYAHYVRMTYLGMASILIGFIIQIIALWV
ncbi:MAG: hypothetical protein PVI41_05900 [Roseobacter sp.]